jgi:hypothetical protein
VDSDGTEIGKNAGAIIYKTGQLFGAILGLKHLKTPHFGS